MSRSFSATWSFTRPANTTQYSSGDLVANSATAGSVVPLKFSIPGRVFRVTGARIQKSTVGTTAADFRLHLYTAAPTFANGDNTAWVTTVDGYLGTLDALDCNLTFTDAGTYRAAGRSSGMLSSTGSDIRQYMGSERIIYGALECRGAYDPGSAEVFAITVEGECD